MTTSTIICVSICAIFMGQNTVLLRSALSHSNSLMSSCSTKQSVLSRISIVMFAHQQNMIVFTVWSTKYGSAGLYTANKMFTNETKRVELFKASWYKFCLCPYMPFCHVCQCFLRHQDTTQ